MTPRRLPSTARAEDSGQGEQLVVQLPPVPLAVRQFRHRVAEVLRERSVGEEVLERALLVAAELVTNAMEASPSDETIVGMIAVSGDVVTIEVANAVREHGAMIAPCSLEMPDEAAIRGRGLPLVAALVSHLEVTTSSGWVTISARLVT